MIICSFFNKKVLIWHLLISRITTLATEELADLQAKINYLQQEKEDLLLKIAGNIALEIFGGCGVMYKDFQIDQQQKKSWPFTKVRSVWKHSCQWL